jgi:flagellar biosynthesis protein FliR
MGFPVAITVAFLIMFFSMPFIMEAFARMMDLSFETLQSLFLKIGNI